jgi:hypothetical protein
VIVWFRNGRLVIDTLSGSISINLDRFAGCFSKRTFPMSCELAVTLILYIVAADTVRQFGEPALFDGVAQLEPSDVCSQVL